MRNWIAHTGLVCALFSAAGARAEPDKRPAAAEAMANLPPQKLGVSDLVSVAVHNSPELTRTIRVRTDGCLRLPMVSRKIRAQGLYPDELEAAIHDALAAEQILVDPVVTVTVVEYVSRPISVAGAVKNPLTFQAQGPVLLLDALAKAEGLGPEAGSEILITWPRTEGTDAPGRLVQRVPVKGLIDEANSDFNVTLHGGEEIRVPEAGRVFVVGNVKRPGAFLVKDSSDTSLLKLLALAEGLLPFAAKRAYIYRREGGSGSKNEIPIELRKVVDRKAPDVPLQANDILYIPDNRGQRLTVTTLERIATFGTATASGMLVWRR